MGKNIAGSLGYWDLMRDVTCRMDELLERLEEIGKNPDFNKEYQYKSSSSYPLTSLEKKLTELNRDIKQYARKSIVLYQDLKRIDKQKMANGTLLSERLNLMVGQHQNITRILMDIRMEQAFLKDIIDQLTYGLAKNMECRDMFLEINIVCREFHMNLDLAIESILAITKYIKSEFASLVRDTAKSRRKRILRRVSTFIHKQMENQHSAPQLVN